MVWPDLIGAADPGRTSEPPSHREVDASGRSKPSGALVRSGKAVPPPPRVDPCRCGDTRHMKKLDRSPKHAKILRFFLHVSSQAIVDRGDLRRLEQHPAAPRPTSVHNRRTFGIPEHSRRMNACALNIDWRGHQPSWDRQRFGTLPPPAWSPETIRTDLGKESPQLSGERGLTCAKTDVPPRGTCLGVRIRGRSSATMRRRNLGVAHAQHAPMQGDSA